MLVVHEYKSSEIALPPTPLEEAQTVEHRNICEQLFVQTLRQTVPVYIEPSPVQSAAPCQVSDNPILVLSLTTLTCYRMPIALWLCNVLSKQYGIRPSTMMAMRTAIHEAIANAVIHGNLGVQEHFSGIKAFNAYHSHILSLLDKPEYAQRRIIISTHYTCREITLRITDEGSGYIHSFSAHSAGELPLGKGLSLIRRYSSNMVVKDGGKTIKMDFAL